MQSQYTHPQAPTKVRAFSSRIARMTMNRLIMRTLESYPVNGHKLPNELKGTFLTNQLPAGCASNSDKTYHGTFVVRVVESTDRRVGTINPRKPKGARKGYGME